MSTRIASAALLLGGGVLFLIFWVASIGFVYWDVYRRNLPWRQQIAWIAVIALLPLIGFIIYLFARFILPVFQPKESARVALKKRETLPLRTNQGQVYLPTIPMEAAGVPAGPVKPALTPVSPGFPSPLYSFSQVAGPATGQDFPLPVLPALIGRGPEAVIRLDADHSISRRHAEVYERSGAVYIRDLDSTHGTQVNGIWIADQRLEPGDEVQVGGSTLVFKVQDGIS